MGLLKEICEEVRPLIKHSVVFAIVIGIAFIFSLLLGEINRRYPSELWTALKSIDETFILIVASMYVIFTVMTLAKAFVRELSDKSD